MKMEGKAAASNAAFKNLQRLSEQRSRSHNYFVNANSAVGKTPENENALGFSRPISAGNRRKNYLNSCRE